MYRFLWGSTGRSSLGEVGKDFTKEMTHELSLRDIRENEENIPDWRAYEIIHKRRSMTPQEDVWLVIGWMEEGD